LKKIYYILIAVVLGILIMPAKINQALKSVIDLIVSNFDPQIDAILLRREFVLSKLEREIFARRIKGIIAQESRGKVNVKNGSAGEIGIMQIKPKVAQSVVKIYPIAKYDLTIPSDNLLIGSLLLYDNYIKSDRDLDLATQRYNQGWIDKTNAKSLVYLAGVKGFENYA
jgi:hypothetical protein